MSKSRPDVSKMTHGFFITINGDTGSCFNSTHRFLHSDPRVAGQLVPYYMYVTAGCVIVGVSWFIITGKGIVIMFTRC